ncbi:adenosylmethionine--8-amino-7-oxononanoate transaminase [Grimontia hollisae]|uniref:Adenosylmethionine-8-amino-7-oxononanoate aminotransferase n=1 Tax=Grimontia hollisae CIP 101886 TaxID=675812 RepID=D0IB09_GRIHO|nr:adenosylmethionine--8-amino-7-oxononanoate transaminase [Grimontia hollisae]AMG32024.1 adenosylmethionine--8-amino-7-oxononanoate transaminase [Grimontia hollisae]EEY71077.1 adenosylmethionine-8-amino-7-oxononanoate aminotransferase [Grimontia hollisae CIP 101886]STO44117.1 Adenosylmethionine-8-amino-7-oxononanoate aminotransferase [Grimontia hollisae]STQ75107.1 Adenosylmethionine-8-amino-7-oxononanoate aminotransferase [Grimontia hollisae]
MDIAFDRNHIWHPYTSTITPLTCYPVTRAEGVYIYLEDGTPLIDGMSSWWAAIHGYNHPALNNAVTDQLAQMSHVMFGGITHEPAIALCKKLVAMTPASLEKVFLCDSGSISVEVALKMALQYWHAKGESRAKFLTLRHGYHGDSFAAMSVTDPDNSMHRLYKGFLPEHIFADSPACGFYDEWHESDIADFKDKLKANAANIAAVILEPIVQGAGGMRIYHPSYLKRVRELCDEYGVLLICDEIATGFGRTGKLFACEHAGIEPDILCLGKALTGGYMTMAATLTTQHVADTVCSGEAGCFMHGPTFMGNPLAAAVANASLQLLLDTPWQEKVLGIESVLSTLLPPLLSSDAVKAVRWLGAIGVVETHHPVNVEAIQKHFVQKGVWIRPFSRLVYIMPPYDITPMQLQQLVDAIRTGLDEQ